jgi:hypothetical protein
MAKPKTPYRNAAEKSAKPPLKRVIILANGLAGVFMFVSWVGQNIYQSEISSKRLDVDRNAQFVTSEMSKVITWLLTFQSERKKKEPDSEIILNSAINYADTTGLIVKIANKIDPDSSILRSHVEEHEKLAKPIREAAERRDINKLQETASAMMDWFRRIDPEAKKAMNHRLQELSRQDETGKLVFRGFFMLASCVFAVTWWKTNLSSPTK